MHSPHAAAPRPHPGELLVCEECDAVYARPPLSHRDVARCRRCGATIQHGPGLDLDGQLALSIGSALVFAIASASPIVTLELHGTASEASLFEAVRHTWDAGEHLVASLALATAFVFPMAVIGLRLTVLLPLLGARWAGLRTHLALLLRAQRVVARWSMVEVFMLGILIAVVRSAGVTDVVLGSGLFAYALLTALLTAMQATGLHALWAHVDEAPP